MTDHLVGARDEHMKSGFHQKSAYDQVKSWSRVVRSTESES